jgi:hypothetical protein
LCQRVEGLRHLASPLEVGYEVPLLRTWRKGWPKKGPREMHGPFRKTRRFIGCADRWLKYDLRR